jgi:hypothetical protein
MKRRGEWKAILGMLLAGALIIGCFVPIVYGVYKVYDKETEQVITLQVKEKPATLYATAIKTIEEKGTKITKRDDKTMTVSGERKDGIKGSLQVTPLPNEASALVITLEKGKDPAEERKAIVDTVLDVCSKLKMECTEDKGKKK